MTDIITPAQWRYDYPGSYYVSVAGINFYYEGAYQQYSLSAPDSQTVRFELRDGDQYAYDIAHYKTSERDEIAAVNNVASNLQPLEISYGLKIEAGPVSTASYLVLGQIHQNLEDTTATGGPVVEVDLAAGDLLSINANYTDAAGVLHRYALWQSNVAITRDQLYNIDIKFVADPTGGSGRLVVSIDGQTVVDYHGKLGDPNMQGVYWAEGLYRDSSANETVAANFSNLQITTGSAIKFPPSLSNLVLTNAANGTYNVSLTETGAANASVSLYDAGVLVGSASTDAQGHAQLNLSGLTAGLHQLSAQVSDPTSGSAGPMSGSAEVLITTAAQFVQQLPKLVADYNLVAVALTDTQTLAIGASANLPAVLGYAAVFSKVNGTILLQTSDKVSATGYDTDVKTYSTAGALLEDQHYLNGHVVSDTVYNGNTVQTTNYASDGSYTETVAVNGQTTHAEGHLASGQLSWSEAVFQDGSREYDYFNTSGQTTRSSVYRADGNRVDITYAIASGGASYAKSVNYVSAAGKTVLSGQFNASGNLTSNTSTGTAGTSIVTYAYAASDGHLASATVQNADGTRSVTSYGADGVTVAKTDYYSSSNVLLNEDTSNPAIAIPSILSVFGTGPSLHPSLSVTAMSTSATGDVAVALTGVAAAGSTVLLYDGSTAISSATADAAGHVVFSVAQASLGMHQFSASATTAAGSAITLGTATVDVEPLKVAITSLGGPTNQASQVISGSGAAGTSLTVYDGTKIAGAVVVAADGSWQLPVSLSGQGAHNFTAFEKDAYGNTATSGAIIYTYDTIAPKLTVASKGGLTGIQATLVSGTGESGTTVKVYDGSALVGTTTVTNSGYWGVTVKLVGDGTHSINATDTDAAGNVSTSAAVSYLLDTVAPTVAITSTAGLSYYPVQTVTGIGEAGTTISIYDNLKLSTTALVASDGTWSAPVTMSGNYTHSVYVLDKDAAGNVGSSRSVLYTLSTVAIANLGGSTNVAHQPITGTGEPGGTVTLFDGTSAVGTVTIAADTSWSIDYSLVGEGAHRLYAQVTDATNHLGFSNVVTYTLDTTAPVVAIGSGDMLTNQPNQTILGTGEAGTTVTLFDGALTVGTAIVAADGTWNATVELTGEGAHSLRVTDTDAAGNVGASGAVTITLDTTAPAIQMLSSGGLSNQLQQLVSGTSEAGASISITDGTTLLTTTSAAADGKWSAGVTLAGDGVHVLNVQATDAAGNSASIQTTYTLDTVAPVVTISGTGGVTNQPLQTLAGTGEAGTAVALYDGSSKIGSTIVDGSGQWSAAISVQGDGQHLLTVQDTDAAGNTSVSTVLPLFLDTIAPVAPTSLSDASVVRGYVNAAGDSANQTLTGSGEAGATVRVYDGTTLLGTSSANSSGTWSYTLGQLLDGSHSLTAIASDAAGNVGAASSALTFKVVTAAPAAPIGLTDSAITNGYVNAAHDTSAQRLSGSATSGSTIAIYDGTSQIGSATAGSAGTWSFLLGKLADGAHSLSAVAIDSYGNASAASSPLKLIADTVAPIATISDVALNTAGATLSGHAEVGSTINVTENVNGIAVRLGVATADANGSWALTTNTLSDKFHVITAQAIDAAANIGSYSAILEFGSSANETIKGVAQGDTIIGGGGNDQLIGGTGVDNFIFHLGSGRDVVSGFDLNADQLFIDHNYATDTASLLARVADVNGAAVVTLSATDSITLLGVTTAQLQAHANDLHFI